MSKLLGTKGTIRDDYGVVYSENKETLWYFSSTFHKTYYKITDGCKKISNRIFNDRPFINYCSGAEFIKRNYPISIQYTRNKSPFIVGKVEHTYLTPSAQKKLKKDMTLGQSLERAVSHLTYSLFLCYDSSDVFTPIPILDYTDHYLFLKDICAIELPESITDIEPKAVEQIRLLNLIIVPENKKNYYQSILGKDTSIVEKQEIDNTDNFSLYPTYYTNSKQLKLENLNRRNKYVEDITILKHIENEYLYPIILLPIKIKKQLSKPIDAKDFISKEVLIDVTTNNTDLCHTLWKNLCRTSDSIVKDDRLLSCGPCEYPIFQDLCHKFPNCVYWKYRKGDYQPDIAININNEIFVDIEIDEPYTEDKYEACHYIGGTDEKRNIYFTSKNWTVLRFAEEQLITENNRIKCIDFIVAMVNFLKTGKTSYLTSCLLLRRSLSEIPRWTKKEAENMAKKCLRLFKYVWNIEEEIKKLETWRAENEKEKGKPDKPEPEPDMGFAKPNEWFT